MPLQHNISDAVRIVEDIEGEEPVLEIQLKYVRYRFVIDDVDKAKEIIAILEKKITIIDKSRGKVEMPKFYRK